MANKMTVKIVSEKDRINFLPKTFGLITIGLAVESKIYDYAGECIEGYKGDYWEFKTVSNGAAYMTPTFEGKKKITQSENFYSGEMSADAIGLALTVLVVNRLAFQTQSTKLADLWQNLMEVVYQHDERKELLRFLD